MFRGSKANGQGGAALVGSTYRLLMIAALLLPLASCEADLVLGYGLPDSDGCRDASVLPGKPLAGECLDTLGAP